MARSVETKYATTPEQEIFGVDPFAVVSNNTLNNIVNKSSSFGGGVVNLLGTAGDVAATAGIIGFLNTGKLDKNYIVDKLGSTLKVDTSFLAKTPIANAGKLLQSMGLVDEKTANLLTGKDSSMSLVDIYTTVHNGYKATVKNIKQVGDGFEQMGKDFEKYIKDDLFDSFSSFTNANSALNPEIANMINTMGLGEELALLRNIVDQTVALEIPGLIDLIIKDIKDEKIQKAVLVQSIPNAVGTGNLELVLLALDIVSPNTIMGAYPTIIRDVLSSYKESADTINLDMSDRTDKLFEILHKLDPKWAYVQREGQWVINLDIFRSMSTAAKSIMYACPEDDVRTASLVGHLFKPEPPLVAAKKYYKYI